MPGRRRATSRAWSASACGGISRRNTPTSGWSCAFTAKTAFSAPWMTTWQTSSWLLAGPGRTTVGRQSLSVSQICAVLPGGHPLAGAGELSFSQLRHEAFLVPDYKISGVEFDTVVTYAGRNGFSPHVVQEADSIPQIFTMVACGCGIAVLSELYRFSAGEHVVFVPLRDIPPSEEHLLWRQRDDKCLNAIVELARRYYGGGM